MKCKHDAGWCAKKHTYVFIFPDGKVAMDFQGKNRQTFKIRMRCNYPECKAERNAYIVVNFSHFGRVKMGESE
jgi:hypothetical protein